VATGNGGVGRVVMAPHSRQGNGESKCPRPRDGPSAGGPFRAHRPPYCWNHSTAPVAQPILSLTEPLLKPSEAADLLAVRTSWIYEAVRAGTLPCLKIGRHIRFTRPMLEDWLATRTISTRRSL
jgi:excisionase family DNA binding protein